MKLTKVLVMTGLACIAMSCASRGGAPTEAGKYSTLKVELSDKQINTPYSATIRGRQDIEIYPQISGKITSVKVNEGQVMKKNQLLFVIDPVPYEAAYRTAVANQKAAQVGVESAKLTYDSKKILFDKNVVSEHELKTAHNSLLSAEAALAQTDAQLTNARNNLSYTEVRSPSNGVVGSLPYRVGSLVGPTMVSALTTVSDNSTMYVYYSLNETQLLSMIRDYGSVEECLKNMPDIELILKDGTVYSEKGRVESISGVIDSKTGAVSVRAEFPNSGRLLHSGASGRVVMPTLLKQCVVIPQAATFELQDKILVYKVVGGYTQSARISVIQNNETNEYVVTEGLAAGDVIIASGAGLLRDSVKVE